MSTPEADIDWSLSTWEGARRAQLRGYHQLPLREKLEAVEGMCDLTRCLHAWRRERGLPTMPLQNDDPATAAHARSIRR